MIAELTLKHSRDRKKAERCEKFTGRNARTMNERKTEYHLATIACTDVIGKKTHFNGQRVTKRNEEDNV